MPRDITHWLLAEDVAALLTADTSYGAAARERPALLALGAIFHDALFYAPPAASGFAWLADRLHGEGGEDSFAPVRGLHRAACELRAAASPLAVDLGAFLVGFVSHLHADATFHPFVFYQSGLPGPGGRLPPAVSQAHRRLEALIDVHFIGRIEALDGYSLEEYLAAAGGRVRDLFWIAAHELVDPGEQARLVTTLHASFTRYAHAQAAFRRRGLARAAHAVRRLLPAGARAVVALAYAPALVALLPRLDGELAYRHPVTGVEARTTLATLRCTAAAAAVATLARLEATEPAAEPLAGEVGPTLVAGIPGSGAAALRLCAPVPLVPS